MHIEDSAPTLPRFVPAYKLPLNTAELVTAHCYFRNALFVPSLNAQFFWPSPSSVKARPFAACSPSLLLLITVPGAETV